MTSENSTRSLQPAEELRLQQLLQMQFWGRKYPEAEGLRETSEDSGNELPGLPNIWELTRGIDLHSWQKECVANWFEAGYRGVIKVVTGAGKTMLAIAIAERLQQAHVRDLRVAIVVPTIVLLDQWREELLTRSNLPPSAIGLLGGGQDAVFDAHTRIIIGVLNSASRKLPAIVKEAGVGGSLLLIVDECHRAGSAEMQKVFRTERAFSLGLSATPERDNDSTGDEEFANGDELPEAMDFEDSVLGKELGPVIFELNYAEAIGLGVLPPFSIVHYGLSLKQHESVQYEKISREIKNLREELERPGRKGLDLIRWCRSKAGASNPAAGRLIALTAERKRLLFRMEERAKAVVRILRDAFDENPDTKAILFHESIDEVMRLFALLQEQGFAVVAEHSEFPDQMRATSLRLFRQDAARVIVSARSLIEGFNVPSADLGIIVAASSSVRQRVQTLGRLLRKSKDTNGAEKHAVLHVLYASKTVDELIYEKADWEHFVGAERNQYFLWTDVDQTVPQPAAKAPRSPAPDETAVDESALQPRETYPGNIDQGLAFTRDTQGTICTEDGAFIEPHPELLAVLKNSRKEAGRFRVTPSRRFVLELDKTDAGWRGVYLGRLSSPVTVVQHSTNDLPERDWKPGDAYPLIRSTGKIVSVLQRDQRLLAMKTKGQVRFVPPLPEISDGAKREALFRIQSFLRSAFSKGHRVNKVTVTREGHVVYVWENQAYFVGHAPEGPEGFNFEA
jgi:superfamily II DNA or RNA helicase